MQEGKITSQELVALGLRSLSPCISSKLPQSTSQELEPTFWELEPKFQQLQSQV